MGSLPKSQWLLILFALVSSNLFALLLGWPFEFLSLQGVMNVAASQTHAYWSLGNRCAYRLFVGLGNKHQGQDFNRTCRLGTISSSVMRDLTRGHPSQRSLSIQQVLLMTRHYTENSLRFRYTIRPTTRYTPSS